MKRLIWSVGGISCFFVFCAFLEDLCGEGAEAVLDVRVEAVDTKE
jgi:hypothetical protein